MEKIKYIRRPELTKPIMIAGWPGMGNVALGAVDFLRKCFRAVKFCEVTLSKSIIHDAVAVERGMTKFPEPPKTTLFYSKSPDLIIIEGESQLSGELGVSLLETILHIAKEFGVLRVFTGAAFPLPMSRAEPSEIFGAANAKNMLLQLEAHGVKMMDDGHISGLNGLLLGFAQKAKVEASCLLATMPQYAIGFHNPKASRAIVDMLSGIHNWHLDTRELEQYIRDVDEKMALIEGKVKDVFTVGKETLEVSDEAEAKKKIPGNIIEKIEQLFREAKGDKKKAYMLKKELDRWDLFSFYEDRFLDLFKESQ